MQVSLGAHDDEAEAMLLQQQQQQQPPPTTTILKSGNTSMTTDLGVAAKISSSGEQLVRNPDLIPIQARGECPFFCRRQFLEGSSEGSF